MSSLLKVQLGDPQAGWMLMTIRSDAIVVRLTVSRALFDTLDELVDGLHALTTGDDYRLVRIFEEPTYCELRFKRENDTVSLEICRFAKFSLAQSRRSGEALLATAGTFAEMCLPFWRALRDLQAASVMRSSSCGGASPSPRPEWRS